MAFVDAIRSVGRAGLFGLTMLRGSAPSRDFLAELVREIYKIGARSLPIIAVGGAFVGLVLTLQGYRTTPPMAPSTRCRPCWACRCTANWRPC